MAGPSGPDQPNKPDSQRNQSGQDPQAHTPVPPARPAVNPSDESLKKGSRQFQEWVNTTQGIVTIMATLVTLIFGGGGIVLALRGNTPAKPSPAPANTSRKPSPTPTLQGWTLSQVKGALLTVSDLTTMDANLTSVDVQTPVRSTGSCHVQNKIRYIFFLTRRFIDNKKPAELVDYIETFDSPSAAHLALLLSSSEVACSLPKPYSLSDISSQINGLCDDGRAWKATFRNKYNKIVVNYLGTVRCGRALVSFEVNAFKGSSFDDSFNLVDGLEIAVPKVEALR